MSTHRVPRLFDHLWSDHGLSEADINDDDLTGQHDALHAVPVADWPDSAFRHAHRLPARLSPSVEKLLLDAASAGFTVAGTERRLHVFKADRWGNVRHGIMVYLTDRGGFHQGHRTDVDLSLALKIGTIKRCREILDLPTTPPSP